MGFLGFGKKKAQADTVIAVMVQAYRDIYSAIHNTPNEYDAIIKFFSGTSELQDSYAAIEQAVLSKAPFTKKKEAKRMLEVLRRELSKCGRDDFGWNRTSIGQQVTENDVFLGNTHGLFTKTIYEWKTASKENQEIVRAQARDFIHSYKELPDTIRNLLGYMNISP